MSTHLCQKINADMSNICACKGIRTCPVCEATGKESIVPQIEDVTYYLYCIDCQKAWPEESNKHPDHTGVNLNFPGIFIYRDFVTPDEESMIVSEIYKTSFVDSQSGRRKQDYGPKVNFKRKKVKCANFTGLPHFSEELYSRMLQHGVLADFVPVEQCHLEYTSDRGSAIDPHFDDFWLWGERLVTINLVSDTVLYFICTDMPDVEVHVPMYARSLVVVYNEARTKWQHAIHRSDIKGKRLALTMRELSEEFQEAGERYEEGRALLDISLTFNGQAVGTPTVVKAPVGTLSAT